jgi:hypothetical protein
MRYGEMSRHTHAQKISVDRAVQSEAIARVGYDRTRAFLFVMFHDRDLYRYDNVPEDLYRAFLAADSKGGFFAKHIRGLFAYRKIGRA